MPLALCVVAQSSGRRATHLKALGAAPFADLTLSKMTSHAAFNALVGLALMLAVVAAYIVLARRFRLLWHPLSIVAAVGIVSVVVAALGELLFRGGWATVPAMMRRSAIGGFGWGLIIAVVVWTGRRLFASQTKRT